MFSCLHFVCVSVLGVALLAVCALFCFRGQVSPDERFEEILGVSDTFIPAANVWVGEYPYLDKVGRSN